MQGRTTDLSEVEQEAENESSENKRKEVPQDCSRTNERETAAVRLTLFNKMIQSLRVRATVPWFGASWPLKE